MMSPHSTTSVAGRVVVGWDGTDTVHDAVAWAARYALRRGLGLSLIQVQPSQVVAGAARAGYVMPRTDVAMAEAAQAALAADARAVADQHPGLEVDSKVIHGRAWFELAEISHEAALLVVGSRSRGAVESLVTASTAQHLAAAVDCPLVVVPADDPTWVDQPVLLATDASSSSVEAGRFAFATADAREVPLVALLACDLHSMRLAYFDPIPSEEELLGVADDRLQAFLAPLRTEFPSVEVGARVVAGDPVEVIRDAAATASLLVCGSRGQGYLRGTMFGSIGRDALREATRPAAIVRPPAHR